MTLEEMSAVFQSNSDEYLKISRIAQPRHDRPDMCALMMLHDLCPSRLNMICSATHDEIFLEVEAEKLADVATEQVIIDLIRCGVRFDASKNSLCMFA